MKPDNTYHATPKRKVSRYKKISTKVTTRIKKR